MNFSGILGEIKFLNTNFNTNDAYEPVRKRNVYSKCERDRPVIFYYRKRRSIASSDERRKKKKNHSVITP